jgi:hypothetical protein
MKFLLSENQLEKLKYFLNNKKEVTRLLESKLKDKALPKDVKPTNKKEEPKNIEPKNIEPKIDKSVLKITSISQLEKVLQVVGDHNKGLKVPTKLKSKFEKEIKFTSDIVSDLKSKLEKLIKTTSAVDHNVNEGGKSVFMSTKNKTDNTGKLKPSSFKAELKKVLKVKSLELPLTEVEIDRQIIKDFLHKVTQDYSSNFAIQRAEGGKNNLVYGK